jgi:hypothetical protein
MYKIKTENNSIMETVNDYIFDLYNPTADFLKNNKGVIAQAALGALEIYAGIKGIGYAQEANNNLIRTVSSYTAIAGLFNMSFGLWFRPIYNVVFRNPSIEDKIKKGELLPEDKDKEKKNYTFFSNQNFYCITHLCIWSIINRKNPEKIYTGKSK